VTDTAELAGATAVPGHVAVTPVPGAAAATAALRDAGADAVIEAARRVGEVLAGRADEVDRAGVYSADNMAVLWAAGLGNLTVPVADGGIGADLGTTLAAVELVAAGDPATALIWVMHLLQLRGLTDGASAWPDHLRRLVISESLVGPALINALRVEPELGTPARGGVPATTAVRTTGPDGAPGWRLDGHKIYATGSHGLRWMVVWAATGPDDPDGQRVGPFLVPADAEGVEIVDTWDHLGLRASASNDVVLHSVVVPADHALSLQDPADTSRPAGQSAAWMVGLLLALYQGVAGAAASWFFAYLNERVPANLGAPLATLPRFQEAAGEMRAMLHTNARLLADLAAETDAGGARAGAAAAGVGLAKVVVTRNVIASVELALSLVGNPGLSHHHPLQRHFRDALCSRIHTPQDDSVLLAAGRSALAQGTTIT
jgi:alkylation response protein AidB-like acyl-CoA dehydrogenase